jgi:uncharacterized protein
MRTIPREQVLQRIRTENPWWVAPHRIDEFYGDMSRREYFHLFARLVEETSVRRAILLMGPRRVGKTVLVHHMIQKLIDDGIDPKKIGYLTIEHPIYNGLGLEELFAAIREAIGDASTKGFYIFFDEIQYLPEWERHLKLLVDSFRSSRFIVTGSAAAALRLKSLESGAGRFTDFLLPPLTFHEYLALIRQDGLVQQRTAENGAGPQYSTRDIHALNRCFVDYLNFGGYPEAVLSDHIRANSGRYIRNDIIDKVLLRDLPSLYGIQDVQELNSLFTSLAYNTANEVTLEELSKKSGVAKNTLKRYIEYLEAAFLLKRVDRVDRSARRFQRAMSFKVYLTNPSIRSALFSPISADDPAMGDLVETAIFAQWFHDEEIQLHYARWPEGEVDIVDVDELSQKPRWAVEVKWSDRYPDKLNELAPLIDFCRRHSVDALVTTETRAYEVVTIAGVNLHFLPASIYCYLLGRSLVAKKDAVSRMRFFI